MLVGGICDAIDLIKADTRTKGEVAWCALKIFLFELPLVAAFWGGILGCGLFGGLAGVYFNAARKR